MRGLYALAAIFPAAAAGADAVVAEEVRLPSAAAARAVCDDIGAGGRKAAAVQAVVYVVTVDPGGFAFAPYDAKRARLGIDTASFVGPDGLELTLNDLVSTPRPGGLEISVPATAAEADGMASKRSSISLDLWFRVAKLPEGRPCAATHRGTVDGLRLAVEPLAFALRQGSQRVASGETPAFAALRAENGPVLSPRVVVGATLRPGGRAPAPVARVAETLKADFVVCYRRGLATDPALRGPLALGVEVAADGRVTEVRAEVDGLGAPEVVTCAMQAVRAARFPKGAARLSIPLRFSD